MIGTIFAILGKDYIISIYIGWSYNSYENVDCEAAIPGISAGVAEALAANIDEVTTAMYFGCDETQMAR